LCLCLCAVVGGINIFCENARTTITQTMQCVIKVKERLVGFRRITIHTRNKAGKADTLTHMDIYNVTHEIAT
jgi:hypothetical protein